MKRVTLKRSEKRVPIAKTKSVVDVSLLSADYLARKVIVHSFLYYVLDAPVISDGEYDRLCLIVAKRWGELHADRQWALGSPDQIRATGHHIKFSSHAVAAALNYHKYNTGEILRNYPTAIWHERRNGTSFVTAAAGKPKRMVG